MESLVLLSRLLVRCVLTRNAWHLLYLVAFTMITMLKQTRGKNTFEQDTKTRDEGAGHTTE